MPTKITFNGPEKPAARKIVGYRSIENKNHVCLLLGGGGHQYFDLGAGRISDRIFGQQGTFPSNFFEPIYEGDFSVTITA